jgi:hypothetical protein
LVIGTYANDNMYGYGPDDVMTNIILKEVFKKALDELL